MVGGDWASDMAIGTERKRAAQAQIRANNQEARADEAVEIAQHNGSEVVRIREVAAGFAGVRGALEKALHKWDPKHPLLQQDKLIAQIMKDTVPAFYANGMDFEASRAAGQRLPMPARPELTEHEAGIRAVAGYYSPNRNDPEALKDGYAGAIAVRNALALALKAVDPNHPLVKDAMLTERLRQAGATAYRMNGDDFSAARLAGETFQIPGR